MKSVHAKEFPITVLTKKLLRRTSRKTGFQSCVNSNKLVVKNTIKAIVTGFNFLKIKKSTKHQNIS